MEVTGYWIFYCNPLKWEIDRFLTSNIEYDTYQITEWQKDFFRPGQLGIIRVGNDNRTKEILQGRKKLIPGIYAVVEVLSKAEKMMASENKFTLSEDLMAEHYRVNIRYLKNLIEKPILLSDLKSDGLISQEEPLIKGRQASSWALNKEVFIKLTEIIGNPEQLFENAEEEKITAVNDLEYLEKKYKDACPEVKEVISKRIERGKISQEIKKSININVRFVMLWG